MSMVKMEELERRLNNLNTRSESRMNEFDERINALTHLIRQSNSDVGKPSRPKINISKLFGKFVGVSDQSTEAAKKNYNIFRRKLSSYDKHSFLIGKVDYAFIYHPILETHDLEF